MKIGFDLVNEKPDYLKSKEQNRKDYIKRYRKIHGEDPPELKKK